MHQGSHRPAGASHRSSECSQPDPMIDSQSRPWRWEALACAEGARGLPEGDPEGLQWVGEWWRGGREAISNTS